MGDWCSSVQINARTELALRYNDISPLENHHCAVAFEILEKVKQGENGKSYKQRKDIETFIGATLSFFGGSRVITWRPSSCKVAINVSLFSATKQHLQKSACRSVQTHQGRNHQVRPSSWTSWRAQHDGAVAQAHVITWVPFHLCYLQMYPGHWHDQAQWDSQQVQVHPASLWLHQQGPQGRGENAKSISFMHRRAEINVGLGLGVRIL